MSYIQTQDLEAGVVATARNTRIEVGIGEPRRTGITAWVRKTYLAKYNFCAKNRNHFLCDEGKKKMMRGGHLLLYRPVILVLAIASIVSCILSRNTKGYVAVTIIISLIYLLLSIYNLYIGGKNGSLLDSIHMLRVRSRDLPGSINEFFKIPIHGRIQDQRLVGIVNEHNTIIAQLQAESTHSSEIDIMVYEKAYELYLNYKMECIFHLILFLILLITGIALASD
ncbi:unnamed protein product [Didymodactylos carnosus]|uniref:Uncharacterized protein n=1 Tax=Didymodactylos carnosus TaxID=1234261 RepID=A0A815J1P4_9BILA|nr:unnamed protein product [Didymodactylos carnosus]CAF1370876.1 unnamed protein product [Didymodactylos carnosus]CAF3854991.1 unnamed protein product [Didymodactylos carnosus]CAF4257122.1 unnamed protein product [Didymodactylos carnosus]